MKKNKDVVALSLFSGCGGLDLGAHLAGVSIDVCIEFDEDSVHTLSLNKEFRNSKIFSEDVRDFPKERLQRLLSAKKKLIVIGGPPCQPFSKAGYWVTNKRRKIDKDPRNMVGEYFRIVKDLEPDGFIFENVESLLHPTNRHTIEEIEKTTKRMGYNTVLIHANALDYGVPQKRKRVFIIGSRKYFKQDGPIKTHADPQIANTVGLLPYESVRRYLSPFNHKSYFEPEEVVNGELYAADLKRVPAGKNYMALTDKFEKGTRFWNFLLKLEPDRPSWTIAAQPGPWIGPFHWENRRLRIPEIAALQTFPSNYKFHGSRRSVQRQIGNAVPVKMAKAMTDFLLGNI